MKTLVDSLNGPGTFDKNRNSSSGESVSGEERLLSQDILQSLDEKTIRAKLRGCETTIEANTRWAQMLRRELVRRGDNCQHRNIRRREMHFPNAATGTSVHGEWWECSDCDKRIDKPQIQV